MRTLGRGYYTHYIHKGATYHYVIFAREYVKSGRLSPALCVGTTMLIGIVKDVELIVINVVADNDISDEFDDRGLSSASLPEKKDSGWGFGLVV